MLAELKSVKLHTFVSDELPAKEKRDTEWVQKNDEAVKLLIEHLADSHLSYTRDKKYARDIWTALENSFERKSYLQLAYVKRKIADLRYDGKSSLTAHLKEFDDLLAELKAAGSNCNELEAVATLISTLPAEFNPLIASFGEIGKTGASTLSVENLKGSLLDYDLKKRDGQSTYDNSTAFYADKKPSKSQSGQSKFPFNCNRCHKKGHMAKDCRVKKTDSSGEGRSNAEKKKNESSLATISFMAETKSTSSSEINNVEPNMIVFAVDSGTTEHMCKEQSQFAKFLKLKSPESVLLADEKGELLCSGVGNIVTTSVTLKNVRYVPKLRRNLLSVYRITHNGFRVLFSADCAEIIDQQNNVVLTAHRDGKLYFAKLEVAPASTVCEEVNLVENPSYEIVHRRLAHLNEKSIAFLKKNGYVRCSNPRSEICDGCMMGKQSRLPHRLRETVSENPLDLIVSDVCAVETPALKGEKYFVTFLDDCTHFSVVYPIVLKSDVFEKFKEFVALAENHFDCKIKRFRSDNGREYLSNEMLSFCKDRGIHVQNTVPYTPQSNGISERLNRSLVEKARCLLQESGLGKEFWNEAIQCATYILNRCPTRENTMIPAEKWYKKKADFSKLRTFGCLAYLHIPDQKRKKMDAKSRRCIMVGYAPQGYRLWDLEAEEIVIGRDVRFDENQLFKDLMVRVSSRPGLSNLKEAEPVNEEEDPAVADDDLNQMDSTSAEDGTEDLRRSDRTRKPPSYLNDYEVSMNLCEALLCDSGDTESDDYWRDAKIAELNSMKKHNVWTLVTKPEGKKIIRSNWVLRTKENGTRKARLVASAWDWTGAEENVYAPVANTITIRTFLVNAVQKGMRIDQMDIKNAFLHGDIVDEVYISQPPGFVKDKGKVCRLNKAIYGLNISPKIFNQCFDQFAVNVMKFQRSDSDRCLYSKMVDGDLVQILIYVDDILVASSNQMVIDNVKSELSKKFDIVDLGAIQTFLGISIEYDVCTGVMLLNQSKFIEKVIDRFGLRDSNPATTPIEHRLQLEKEEKVSENVPFRQLIGSLLYVNISTRPDISFAVNYLSQFQNCYSKTHFEHAKRIVRYLKGTKMLKLKLSRTQNPSTQPLRCYVDADWANDINDRRSVTGYCIFFYGNPIAWCTRKQLTVTVSSTDAELVAVSNLINDHLLWIIQLAADDFGAENCMPVPIYEDNQGAIALLNDTKVTGRSKRKHIDTRFRFIKEGIKAKEFEVVYTSTQNQLADILTKGLPRPSFERFRGNFSLIF